MIGIKKFDSESIAMAICMIFVMAMCYWLGFMDGKKSHTSEFEREAVRQGAAEYVVDVNKNATFRWRINVKPVLEKVEEKK